MIRNATYWRLGEPVNAATGNPIVSINQAQHSFQDTKIYKNDMRNKGKTLPNGDHPGCGSFDPNNEMQLQPLAQDHTHMSMSVKIRSPQGGDISLIRIHGRHKGLENMISS